MKDVTVVVLAGGKSTRFWPLSNKLLIPFLGKTLLEQQIDMLGRVGFGNIVVVTSAENVLSEKGIVQVLQEGEGQGAAILSVKDKIAGKPILVINADDVVDTRLFEKIKGKIAYHKNILVGYRVKRYFPGGYVVLKGSKVSQVVEKPEVGKEPSNIIKLVCDYFTNSDELLSQLEHFKGNTDSDRHYEYALTALMNQGHEFELLEYQGTWIPLKYPWQTLFIKEHYLDSISKTIMGKNVKIHKTASIMGPVIFGDGVRVMEYAKIVGPSYIGAGTIIGNHTLVRSSMIGDNTVIGFGSEVTRSYIGNNCWFHTNYIGDSVVFHNVGMGAGAVCANLRLDEEDVRSMIKNQPVSTERNKMGAIIGSDVRIGVNAQLMPGIKVGRGSLVGPGVILAEDVPDETRCVVRQTYIRSRHAISSSKSRDQFRKDL